MSERTAFNVIIPTRERADTLLGCLRTATAQDYDRLRIIVSDNFSADDTRDVVMSVDDPRITYVNTGERLGMSQNWEFALGHVDSGWVMYVGDDDGLLLGALDYLDEIIRAHGAEAVSSARAKYVWPGFDDDYPDGLLVVPMRTGARLRDAGRGLRRVFAGVKAYETLPWLYTGGAATLELIDRLRGPDGRFFRSQNPDIYSSIAFSSAVDRYLWSDRPFAINGASRHSIGRAQQQRGNQKQEAPAVRFAAENTLPFHPDLIELGKSLQVMLHESYLQSWHIHGGAPGVSLEETLAIAPAVATPGTAEQVDEECRRIAAHNDIVARRPSPARKLRIWAYNKRRRVAAALWHLAVIGSPTDPLPDVYDAAERATDLYRRIHEAASLRGTLLRHLLRRAAARIRGAAGPGATL